MSSVVEVVMNSEVVLKSNKRRINFLTAKIAELSAELVVLESQEEAFEASRSQNVTKRNKGRPQSKKSEEAEVDLFANLVKEVVSSECEVVSSSVETPVVPAKNEKVSKEKKEKPVKHVLSEEEKAAKKAGLEQEKALKKAQLEQAKAEDKLAKAEEKKLQLEAAKLVKAAEKALMSAADKESKKAQLEAEKLAKAEAKKQALEQEKALKKQALYEEKMTAALKKLETKQALAEAKKQEKALKKAVTKKASAVVVESKEEKEVAKETPVEKVTVSRITINDIKYLKSNTNILYNPDTREEVGLYDPETKTIKPLPDDEEEEMTEDVYESDDE